MTRPLAALVLFALPLFSQMRMPDLAAQREAMKKLDFLAGKWVGEAKVQRGPGEPLTIRQAEDVQYKLDGLLLLVEGTGTSPADGKVLFHALATITYDDVAGSYKMRAHSDGRITDTELKLPAGGRGFDWAIDAGPMKISYVMRLNDKGEWVETGEMKMGEQPARKFIEMTVRPKK